MRHMRAALGVRPRESNPTCECPRAELLPRAAALPVQMMVPDLAAIRAGFPRLPRT
jgi:hypothetical protein